MFFNGLTIVENSMKFSTVDEGPCPGKTVQKRFHTIWEMQFKGSKFKQEENQIKTIDITRMYTAKNR